jgi:hypothetical protein
MKSEAKRSIHGAPLGQYVLSKMFTSELIDNEIMTDYT